MIKSYLAFVVLFSAIFASQTGDLTDNFLICKNFMELNLDVRNECFSRLPSYELFNLSRSCKAFGEMVIKLLRSNPKESIAKMIPFWYVSEPESPEQQNMKSLLGYLLSSLQTGEPEDFMVDILRTELFEESSDEYLVAAGRYPEIVSAIIKYKKSKKDWYEIAPSARLVHYLDLDLLSEFPMYPAFSELKKFLFDYLQVPKFDVMKLCKFLDHYHPSFLEHKKAEIIGIFSGDRTIESSLVDKETLSVSIYMLRLNQEEKKCLLKTLTGVSDIALADDQDVEDAILYYLESNQALVGNLILRIPEHALCSIPQSFLGKLMEKFSDLFLDGSHAALSFLISGYPSKFYESITKTNQKKIEETLSSNPIMLQSPFIMNAIVLLPDLALLYEKISQFGEKAHFSSYHLFLILASNKCDEDLKRKFALLPFFQTESYPEIPPSEIYEFGKDFSDPIIKAFEGTSDHKIKARLLNFCTFLPRYQFGNLMLLSQYKLFALKFDFCLRLGHSRIYQETYHEFLGNFYFFRNEIPAIETLTVHLLSKIPISQLDSLSKESEMEHIKPLISRAIQIVRGSEKPVVPQSQIDRHGEVNGSEVENWGQEKIKGESEVDDEKGNEVEYNNAKYIESNSVTEIPYLGSGDMIIDIPGDAKNEVATGGTGSNETAVGTRIEDQAVNEKKKNVSRLGSKSDEEQSFGFEAILFGALSMGAAVALATLSWMRLGAPL